MKKFDIVHVFCSTSVFGVSTESMQLSYDSRGNSVPTILLLMQRHLYAQGALQVHFIVPIMALVKLLNFCKFLCFALLHRECMVLQAEGIFRINGENSQEEYVRNQLNRGIVPEGTDIHCLAGLIKVCV